jgi:VWFA-related protein
MTAHLKRLLLLPLIATICCSVANAQTSAPIVLNVTVANQKGDFIDGLSREHFSVTVDKLPLNIVSLTESEVPASVGILIDTSGSFDNGKKAVASLKQNLKQGVERFLKQSHPGNEYFVMTFDRSVTLVQDWTNEHSSVTNTLDTLKFDGMTSFYDAVNKAIPKFTAARNAKHVLIVFTDGVDNNSTTKFKQVRQALKSSDVIVYFVGAFEVNDDPIRSGSLMHLGSEGGMILDELAAYSGGKAFFAKNTSTTAFDELFEYLATELRWQYQLVISPQETSGQQKWRKLDVSVVRNDASGRPQKMFVRTRAGYYQ